MDERFWRSVEKVTHLFRENFTKAEERQPGLYRTIVRDGWLLFIPAAPLVLALTREDRVVLRAWDWSDLGHWVEMSRAELDALAPALRRWTAVRESWHWFWHHYGMMSSFSHHYQAPGKNGKQITTIAGGMGCSKGQPLTGKDRRVALRPHVIGDGGVIIAAKLIRVGEKAVKLPQHPLVGEVYRLSDDLEARATRGELEIQRLSGKEYGEGQFIRIEPDWSEFIGRVAAHGR